MSNSDANEDSLRLVSGGEAALAELFLEYRERLERMVEFRLDPRIRGRLDASDVVQEAFFEISRRLPEYVQHPAVSPFVWMRQRTLQTMIDLQRKHFRDKRSPLRESSPVPDAISDGTSIALASYLIAEMTSPSQAAVKAEEMTQLTQALESMNEMDREVLALRHFELLTNQQVAEILELSITAASNRYVRAAARLGEIMKAFAQLGNHRQPGRDPHHDR